MRRALKILVVSTLVLVLSIVVLYLAVPPNTEPDDGAADPILGIRRVAVAFLRDLGVMPPAPFFGRDPYFPSAGSTAVLEPGHLSDPPDLERPMVWKMTISREPVYRGVLWAVGDRIRYEQRRLDARRLACVALRLYFEEDGERSIVNESRVDSKGKSARVSGYVPRSADAYGVEELLADGSTTDAHEWRRK